VLDASRLRSAISHFMLAIAALAIRTVRFSLSPLKSSSHSLCQTMQEHLDVRGVSKHLGSEFQNTAFAE
jgi:hypothetical protein